MSFSYSLKVLQSSDIGLFYSFLVELDPGFSNARTLVFLQIFGTVSWDAQCRIV